MESQRVGHDWATELNWTELGLWEMGSQWQACNSLGSLKDRSWHKLKSKTSTLTPIILTPRWGERPLKTVCAPSKLLTSFGQLLLFNKRWWCWTQKFMRGTSLVAQWLRIYLPVQGSRVWSLVQVVQEDSTCCRATKPIYCNCWRLRALEAVLCEEKPPQCETHALQLEKACTQQWRPSTAKHK